MNTKGRGWTGMIGKERLELGENQVGPEGKVLNAPCLLSSLHHLYTNR